MVKLTKRKGFNFFRSYFDVYNLLEDADKVLFMDALLNRQFLGVKPSNLEGMAEFAYVSQTNSIDSQVKGYEDKTKTKLCDTQTVNPPTEGGTEGATQGGLNTPSLQVEVEEKEKGKEKGKEDINTRKQDFYKSLIPFLDTYSKDLLKDFFEYWTEHDVNDKKFRREKEKSFSISLRLKNWNKNTKKFNQKSYAKKEKKSAAQIIQEEIAQNQRL
jgi:hypothetical protein